MSRPLTSVAAGAIPSWPGLPASDLVANWLANGRISGTFEGQLGHLHKAFKQGRLANIQRYKSGREFWYFAKSEDGPQEANGPRLVLASRAKETALTVPIKLSAASASLVEALVEVGDFTSQSEAIGWLIKEGILAHEGRLRKAQQLSDEIRRLREEHRREFRSMFSVDTN